jgi:hypothetical protein
MKQYRIASTPMIHSPGVFRWILETIRPFDVPKAQELFAAMGLPEEVAARLAESDPGVSVTYDGETVIVEASARPVEFPTEDVNLAAPNQQARGFILRPSLP